MTEQQKNAALIGGTTIEVTYRDGTKESVTVQCLPLRKIPEYLEWVDNEPNCAEKLCNKPEGWADSITDESVFAICDAGAEINHPRLLSWANRQVKKAERLMPMTEIIQSASRTSAPKLRPLPGPDEKTS